MQFVAGRATFVLTVAIFLCSVSVAQATSHDPCPGQGRISTGTGQDAGFPAGSKICPTDGGQQQLYGGCPSNPYQILETQFKGSANVQITPQTTNGTSQGGIDSALACRLTQFLEAAKQRGCNPKLSSAYRSAQQQQNMCGAGRTGCAPAGASCHQYGLAVDVTASCIGWMRMAAPQFQLVFPYYGDHIQCAEHPRASCSPATQPCNGGIRINPDLSRLPSPGQVPDSYFSPPPPAAPPSSGLSNQFRQALGMPQQPSIPSYSSPTPDTSAAANLPQPTQSQFCLPEYKCSGKTLLYQNSFCATQVSEQCAAGCSNGACIAATSTDNTNTNNNDDTGSSTIDILGTIGGYSATSTSIGTATPLQLILGLSQDQTTTNTQTSQRPFAMVATGSIGNTQLIGAQQTFTSQDLNQNLSSNTTLQNRSALFAILETMKKILLWALEYLRPFRISQSVAEQQEQTLSIE